MFGTAPLVTAIVIAGRDTMDTTRNRAMKITEDRCYETMNFEPTIF